MTSMMRAAVAWFVANGGTLTATAVGFGVSSRGLGKAVRRLSPSTTLRQVGRPTAARPTGSASDTAAREYLRSGGTMQDVGARHGISGPAVSRAVTRIRRLAT